jgi:hypothetical protein
VLVRSNNKSHRVIGIAPPKWFRFYNDRNKENSIVKTKCRFSVGLRFDDLELPSFIV